MSYYDENDALYHHGVLGMKWGRRKDGGPQGYEGTFPEKRRQRIKRIRKTGSTSERKALEKNVYKRSLKRAAVVGSLSLGSKIIANQMSKKGIMDMSVSKLKTAGNFKMASKLLGRAAIADVAISSIVTVARRSKVKKESGER